MKVAEGNFHGPITLTILLFFWSSRTRTHRNSIDFDAAVDRDDEALAAINLAGFNEVGAVRIDFDDDIRGFDLEGAGVCNVACVDGSFFACSFIEALIKSSKLFFFNPTVFQKIADLIFVQDEWFRFILMFLDQFA